MRYLFLLSAAQIFVFVSSLLSVFSWCAFDSVGLSYIPPITPHYLSITPVFVGLFNFESMRLRLLTTRVYFDEDVAFDFPSSSFTYVSPHHRLRFRPGTLLSQSAHQSGQDCTSCS